jgi:hypothetical protein
VVGYKRKPPAEPGAGGVVATAVIERAVGDGGLSCVSFIFAHLSLWPVDQLDRRALFYNTELPSRRPVLWSIQRTQRGR